MSNDKDVLNEGKRYKNVSTTQSGNKFDVCEDADLVDRNNGVYKNVSATQAESYCCSCEDKMAIDNNSTSYKNVSTTNTEWGICESVSCANNKDNNYKNVSTNKQLNLDNVNLLKNNQVGNSGRGGGAEASKIPLPQKIIAVIVSLALIISLLGSGTYFILNYLNHSKAIKSSNYTSIGNMLKDSDTVNYNTYQALLTALGNNTTSTRNKSVINGGTPVVFQMGEAFGKPIYWQVVYQVGDIITVWMTDCYTREYYNRSGGAVENSVLVGYTTGPYANYSNYSKSVIRDVTKGIFNSLSANSPVISKVVKSPSEANATWQQGQKEDMYVARNSSSSSSNAVIDGYYEYAHHNNLYYSDTSNYGGIYIGWAHSEWNSADQPYSDKFWIPSYYEVFNTTNHITSTAGYIAGQDSLWGLTDTDRDFTITALDSNSVSYYWLSSGYSSGSGSAVVVRPLGLATHGYVYGNSYGVRPAAHISLSALSASADCRITSSVVNGNVDKNSSDYIRESGIDHTFTFTPNINYFIDSITIGAMDGSPAQTSVAINDSQPSNYSTLTALCKYKVYRDGNTVKVVVNELTEHISIIGSGGTTISIINSGNITNIDVTRADYNVTTGTVSATYASGYYPQFCLNTSAIIKITSASGKGSLGSVQYNYTFLNNIFNITFTNLPTGADNIPTLNLTAYTLDNYDITVNAPNCLYEIIYESTQTLVLVTPNTGFYITQAYVDSNTPEDIKNYMGALTRAGNALAVSYYASDTIAKIKFVIHELAGNLTLNIVTGNTKPILSAGSGTKIDGVALQTKLAGSSDTLACVGKATITGYTTTDGLDDVIVYATASAGYKFDHWEIDGTALDTLTYGISAYIPYEMLDGKILVAVFAPNTSNTNDTINTPDNGGFV